MIKKLCLIFISSLFLAYSLLCLVHLIPTDKIEKNTKNGIITADKNEYYNLDIDSFGEKLILSQTFLNTDEKIIEKVINNYFQPNENQNSPHKRYWGGHKIITKPIFYVFEFFTIQKINIYMQISLTFLSILIFFKKRKEYLIPFLIALYSIDPVTIAISMQSSICFYIIILSTIIILHKNSFWKENSNYIYLFFLIGICTSFFDLLTYPITTLIFPLITFLLINSNNLKENIIINIKSTLIWITGYLGFWSCKWISSSIILQNIDSLKDAFIHIRMRISHTNSENPLLLSTEKINILDMLSGNFNNNILFHFPQIIIPIIYILVTTLIIVLNNKNFSKKKLKNSSIFLFIATYPIIWYLLTINHSYQHNFANKTLSGFVYGILAFITYLMISTKDSKN